MICSRKMAMMSMTMGLVMVGMRHLQAMREAWMGGGKARRGDGEEGIESVIDGDWRSA